MENQNQETVENNSTQPEEVVENNTNDSVSYESHRKLLGQHKSSQAKLKEVEQQLAELKAEKEAALEAQLAEQGKWEELARKREQELNDFRASMEAEKAAVLTATKQLAFKEHVGELASPAYLNLVDWNSIPLTEDGKIDNASLIEYGNRFKEEHAGLFKQKKAPLDKSPAGQSLKSKPQKGPQTMDDLKALWAKK